MTQRLSWSGLEPPSPVHRAEMLKTRPPSRCLQCSLLLKMDLFSQLLTLPLFTVFSVSLEYVISRSPVLWMLYYSSANQNRAKKRLRVVDQSGLNDVNLGASKLTFVKGGLSQCIISPETRHYDNTLVSRAQDWWRRQLPDPRLPKLSASKFQDHYLRNSWEEKVEEVGFCQELSRIVSSLPQITRVVTSKVSGCFRCCSSQASDSMITSELSLLQLSWYSSQFFLGVQATLPNSLQILVSARF